MNTNGLPAMMHNSIRCHFLRDLKCSPTEHDFRRVARCTTDCELLTKRQIGRRSLALFRELYGPYEAPLVVERPEDV